MQHEQNTFAPTSETNQPSRSGGWFNSRNAIIGCAIVGIIGAIFLTGHSNHVIAALPYLLLLACPFMHFFMHGRHGKHGSDSSAHH